MMRPAGRRPAARRSRAATLAEEPSGTTSAKVRREGAAGPLDVSPGSSSGATPADPARARRRVLSPPPRRSRARQHHRLRAPRARTDAAGGRSRSAAASSAACLAPSACERRAGLSAAYKGGALGRTGSHIPRAMLIRQPAAPWCRPEAGVRRAHCRGSAGPLRALGGPHRVRCAARAGDEEAAISEGDMASKLAKAEEEAAKLREELDRVRTQEAQAAASAPAAKESRIDGRSYRETGGIVMGRKKGGDLEFGAGLTEADVFRYDEDRRRAHRRTERQGLAEGQDESEIIDAQKVRRNLLVGAGVTVGTALLSTVRFRLPSSKPLYTYLVPVLTAQVSSLLVSTSYGAPDGAHRCGSCLRTF
eukprot:scaffold2175_cov381-Prasinococcus_capsulatus_cf.AAC.8